jgi:CelD/BcsL family acetyltransferase involved in cellulose biosynthesis
MAALAPADVSLEASEISLTRADSQDSASWDRFVEQHPEGRFCQLWGYKRVLEEAVGYDCVYLNIVSHGERVGLFPSIAVRRGSRRLVSQPFNEYGGPLTQGLSERQHRMLPELFMQVAAEEGCRAIEIRGGIGCEAIAQSELCRKHPLHFYGSLELAPKEQLWRKSLTHEARKDVARAEREGLETEIHRGMNAIGGCFYELYLKSMKRLGVPPHSYRFFATLAEEFGTRLIAAWVALKSATVAVLLGAITGNRLHVFVTASDSGVWRMRPNDLAYWRLIEWAASAGFKTFDFGSARYPGQIQFKKKWGVNLREYSCYCIGAPGSGATSRVQSVRTNSRSMVALSRAWRTAVPISLSRVLGPPVRKYLTK